MTDRGDSLSTSTKASFVSIIVCTRNRAVKLERTLRTIGALEVPEGSSYEVIVVDNGSTDATATVCAQLEKDFSAVLRRVFLPTPGLSRAGNTGFVAAQGNIIAYLDDDVLPRKDWLAVLCREFAADPQLGVLCGRVELWNPEHLPLATRRQEQRREFQQLYDAFSLFIGCNLAIRRTVIEKIGLFDPVLGTGSRFGSAGDSDFCYRAWKAGQKLVYVPALFVYHDHGRRSLQDRRKVMRDYTFGRGAFYAKHACARDKAALRAMYWELLEARKSLLTPGDDLGWRHVAWLSRAICSYTLRHGWRIWRNGIDTPAKPEPARETPPAQPPGPINNTTMLKTTQV